MTGKWHLNDTWKFLKCPKNDRKMTGKWQNWFVSSNDRWAQDRGVRSFEPWREDRVRWLRRRTLWPVPWPVIHRRWSFTWITGSQPAAPSTTSASRRKGRSTLPGAFWPAASILTTSPCSNCTISRPMTSTTWNWQHPPMPEVRRFSTLSSVSHVSRRPHNRP